MTSHLLRSRLRLLTLALSLSLILTLLPTTPALAVGNCPDLVSWELTAQGIWWDNWWQYGARTACVPVTPSTMNSLGGNWGIFAPITFLDGDNWSAVWRGQVRFTSDNATHARVRFTLNSDDGAKVYVGGQLIVNDWERHAARTKVVEAWIPTGTSDLTMYNYEATGEAVAELRWDVVGWNYAPRLPVPNQPLIYTESDEVQLRGSDLNQQPLTYQLVSGRLPPGLSVDPNRGVIGRISYDATALSEEYFPFTLRVSDGLASDQKTYLLKVTNARPGATLDTFNPLIKFQVGTPASWSIPYYNPTNSVVEFEVSSLPAGLRYDPATKSIVGTPTAPAYATGSIRLIDRTTNQTDYRSVTWFAAGVVAPPGDYSAPPDLTPPTVTASPDRPPNAAGWYNEGVTISFTCADAESGVQVCPEPITVVTEGQAQSVAGTAFDGSGNTANAATTTLSIDLTPPTLTGAPDRAPNAEGWYNSPVTVTWTANDALSGIADLPAETLLTEEGGILQAEQSVSDRAGNQTTVGVTGIKIDQTAPVTVASVPSGWQAQAVTLDLTASDNLSGVASTSYTIDGGAPQTGNSILLTADGTHAITFWSTDSAGNQEAPQGALVQIDQTAPVITGHTSTTGWTNGPVTVTFECADSTSGLADCPAPVTLSAEGKDQSVTGTAVDLAGNAAATTITVSIDQTAPVIQFTGNAGVYTVDQEVRISCTALDGLSGISTSACSESVGPAYAFNLGANSVTATAVDAAGNVGTGTASFVVTVDHTSLATLTRRFAASPAVAGALVAKLEAAQRQRPDRSALIGYINQVRAQTGKAFTAVQAEILVRLAQSLQNA